jgi:hypothetical protein
VAAGNCIDMACCLSSGITSRFDSMGHDY